MNEETVKTYKILPALQKSGWNTQELLRPEFPITDGKVIATANSKPRRESAKHADYALFYKGQPIAIVEAKKNKPLQQEDSPLVSTAGSEVTPDSSTYSSKPPSYQMPENAPVYNPSPDQALLYTVPVDGAPSYPVPVDGAPSYQSALPYQPVPAYQP